MDKFAKLTEYISMKVLLPH